MRRLILATSVALALGSAPAIAQTGLARASAANTTSANTTTTTTTSTTAPSATNPSEFVTTPSSSSSSASSTSGNTSTSDTGGSSSVAGGSQSGFGSNTTTTVPTNSDPSFGAGSTFATDSGNTALGLSPGQTSSGTAAGNSSSGLGAGSATLDPSQVGTLGNGPAVTNPDGTTLGTGVNVVGERVAAPQAAAPAPAPSFSIVNTPTFDQVAREGRAKEQARKARGQEPRIIGIAPNTDKDLTWQMPDDKIIRY